VGANLTITVRPVTITADAKSKVYGAADPALTCQITSGSLAFSDAFTGALTRDAGENVGTYAITQGTVALSANYALTYVGANLTITVRPVTITADAKSKVYGGADPALTYQITSGSLAFSDAFSGSLTRVAGESVSSYAINQGSVALSANYALTYVGANLTVTPAPLTVTTDPQTKVYGQADPMLTYQVSGLENGDTAGGVLSGSLTRVAGEHVGSYAISQGSLVANANYTVAFTGNNLTITVATLTVAAYPQTKVYGQSDPALTYHASGFRFSDSAATVLSGILTRAPGEHVAGSPYAISQGGLVADSDYIIAFTGNNLTITTATLTVTADPQTKVYGQRDPALTYQASGFKFADTATTALSGMLTRAAGEHVAGSPYAISQGSLVADGDYTIAFTGNNLTITVAPLTVTADPRTKVYGQSDPALTYKATGFQFTDTAATVLSGMLTRVAGEGVGTYAITQGSLVVNADYTISFVGNLLTITQAQTSTMLVLSPITSVLSSNVTFTATVNDSTPGSTGTPTGIVTFKDGAITLGTGTLVAGVGTFTTSSLSVGSHSISAVYGGDPNFTGSTSSSLTETVLPFVTISWEAPLAGQPVANKIKVGQVVPHKVDLVNSLGQTITTGVTVKLQVQGIQTSNAGTTVFQDVVEDANGIGTDGTANGCGIMYPVGGHFQFNLDTSDFCDLNTLAESNRYYTSTVFVFDNATGILVGVTTINLETSSK
jgi:hypothetical protein